jgi:hypothetical protein
MNRYCLGLIALMAMPTFAWEEAEPQAGKDKQQECKLCRWVDLRQATFTNRYRWVKSSNALFETNQTQQQQVYDMQFKADKKARVTLNARFTSGYWFTRSFAESGWGKQWNNEKGWSVFPRHFWLSVKPMEGVEIQTGGLNINYGEATEATYYDNDGFITGHRLKIKRPDKLWFDELSATFAYIGDYYTPNFFSRGDRLNNVNYVQYLGAKKAGPISASFAYTRHEIWAMYHEAVRLDTRPSKFIDAVRVEFYQRPTRPDPGYGFGVSIEKTVKNRLFVSTGYAEQDYNYNILNRSIRYPGRWGVQVAGTLTSDRLIRGNSPWVNWQYKVSPEYSLIGFWCVDINKDPRYVVFNSSHFSVGFQVNLKEFARKTGWL